MLKKAYRLRANTRIQGVKLQGQSFHNRLLVLVKHPGERQTNRFAVSVSRRIGNAVIRNRIKRLIREAIRQRLPCIQGNWDVLLIARQPAQKARFSDIDRAVADLFRRSLLSPGSPSQAEAPNRLDGEIRDLPIATS